MPIGVIINSLSIILGGIIGALVKDKLSQSFKDNLTLVFSVCALGMGISTIGNMEYMPAVIFAMVLGTSLGMLLHFGEWIHKGAVCMERPIARFIGGHHAGISDQERTMALVTVIVLFCASGTGIYGSMDSGMTGDHSILISKSILDFFTAAIFACHLGYVVSCIAVPQFVIFFLLFLSAGAILPFTTPEMLGDFKACGGFLMIATGFRMMKVKEFPVADMIPAMILVMPISWMWVNWILPLL